MSNRRCAAASCLNQRSDISDKLRFHNFPSQVWRSKKWAENVGRPDLAQRSKFNGYQLCSDHFEDRMYNRPQERFVGSSLVHNAVPTLRLPKPLPYVDRIERREIGIQTGVFSLNSDKASQVCLQAHATRNASTLTAKFVFTSACGSQTARCLDVKLENLQARVKKLRARLKQMQSRQRMRRFRSRNLPRKATRANTVRSGVSLLRATNFPVNLKEFLISQFENKNRPIRGRRYTPLVNTVCYILFHYSPTCYEAFRQIFILPTPRGLRHHLQMLMNEPGFCTVTKAVLSKKMKDCPVEPQESE